MAFCFWYFDLRARSVCSQCKMLTKAAHLICMMTRNGNCLLRNLLFDTDTAISAHGSAEHKEGIGLPRSCDRLRTLENVFCAISNFLNDFANSISGIRNGSVFSGPNGGEQPGER